MTSYLKHSIYLLIFLLIVTPSYSMGIRGYNLRANIDYEPELVFSQTYQIRTTSPRAQDYILTVRGDLAKYVTLEPDKLENIAPGADPYFLATLRLPAGLDKEVTPGTHEIKIAVRETAPPESGGVSVLTGAAAIIKVRFLFPVKYLSASVRASDTQVDSVALVEIDIFNGGKENINSVKADIEVYDNDGKIVGVTDTEEKSVESSKSDVLHAKISTRGLSAGNYKAVAKIHYDGLETEAEDWFKIGALEVKVTDYTREVPAGKINSFDIEVESNWNSEIQSIYAITNIGNQQFQTPTTNLRSWEKKTLTGYLDTSSMQIGEYDAKITLYYDGTNTIEKGKVKIVEPEEGAIIAAPVSTIPTATIMLIMIIVLLIIADVIFVMYSRKNKKKQEELEKLIRAKLKK